MDLVTSFIIASGIILLGFIANAIFRRTYIPDTLSLIFLGVLLGPGLTYIAGISIFPREQLLGSLEYIAQLTLALVMFDAGMSLDIYKIVKESPRGVTFSIVNFIVSTVLITMMAKYFLNLRWSYCFFLGAVLATAGSAVVVPLVMKLHFSEDVKHILIIEAALSDVYTLIFATTLLAYMRGTTTELQMAIKQLVSSVSVGLLVGALIGLFWIYTIEQLSREEHSYVATLGALLVAYTVTTWLEGSGAMAALAFGLIIGNHRFITLILGLETGPLAMTELTVTTRSIHGEITFIVRSFFFVVMGLLYTWPIGNMITLFLGVLASLLLLSARAISMFTVASKSPLAEIWTASSIYGRGLVPALFAQFLITYNLYMGEMLYDIILNTIIITNILMTLGVYLFGRRMHAEIPHLPKGIAVRVPGVSESETSEE